MMKSVKHLFVLEIYSDLIKKTPGLSAERCTFELEAVVREI